MTYFKIFLVIFINCIVTYARISDKRLCADKYCSEPISLARTLLSYASIDKDRRILSFPKNVDVKIFSKAAGSRSDLWGAEINGKRGYVPISHVRETKILSRKLDHLVSTDEDTVNNSAPTILSEVPKQENILQQTKSEDALPVTDQISPNSVSPPYEVIDGTTIYIPSPNVEESTSPNEILVESIIEPTLSVTPDPKAVFNNLHNNVETIEAKENVDKEPENKQVTESTLKKENEQSVTEEKGGVLESISKFFSSTEDDGTETDEDEEHSEDDEEEIGDEEDNEAEEEEENGQQEETKTGSVANVIAEVNKEEIKIIEQTNSDIPNVNSENSTLSSSESDEVKMDQLQDTVVPQSVQNDTASEVPAVEVNEKSEEKIENPVKESEYKNFYGVPSKLLRNSFNTLPKTSEEVVHEQNTDTVDYQVPVNSENSTPLPVQPEVVEYATTTSVPMLLDEIPVPLDTVTESPVTENRIKAENENQIKESIEIVQDNPANGNVDNAEINEIINDQTNGINNSSLNDTETMLHTNPGNSAVEEQKLSNIENFEHPENIFSDLSLDKENLDSGDNSEQPSHNFENTESEEDIFSNVTIGGKKLDYSAENSEQSAQVVENSEKVKNMQQNSEGFLNPESTAIENNDQSKEKTEDLSRINDLSSEEKVPDESVKVSEQEKEKVEISVPNSEQFEETSEVTDSDEPGFLSKVYSTMFGSSDKTPAIDEVQNMEESRVIEEATERRSTKDSWKTHAQENPADKYISQLGEKMENIEPEMQSCKPGEDLSACLLQNENDSELKDSSFDLPENAYSIFLYLSLTSVTLLLFILGYYYIEKKRNDGSLVISINELEKKLLIASKECILLQDELNTTKERLCSIEDSSFGSNEMVTALKEEIGEAKNVKYELEEQIVNLEKELENATEAGMELNRMLREVLSSQSGNDHLMQNIEHLQKQLNEQQVTINNMNSTLGMKNTENELLQTELSVAHEKISLLQAELDRMVVNLLSVQEEKCKGENEFEEQTQKLKHDYDSTIKNVNFELNVLNDENGKLKSVIEKTQRELDVKNNEYSLLKEGMKEVQAAQSNKESLKALLDVSKVKAEVQQLREEKHKMSERFQAELEAKLVFEKEVQVMMQEVQILKDKFEEADRQKVEAQTRLEVLSGYFKEKETQLQKEINENESKWIQKEGEATTTVERIKWIQEELQNYKSQNEMLKKEILDQEVSLKSQISMLEKKAHDNWVLARQAERRVEESKQEASQLRNRLTIVEKNLNNTNQVADESKMQNRIMSPLESNGEIPVSPLHMTNVENQGSPPLLFPHRDHMTTSPPLPGMPPFMPPPPGVPFMPPPMPGVPPFMPPPPALYPGDHRPPPLGRMSSPPLHGRYSPDSRAYSPYDRDDSPPLSPTYTDNDYRRRSPPPPPTSHMPRIYNPYTAKGRQPHWEEEREYRGQQQRSKPRTHKGPGLSSGSGNSNESLDNSGRHSGRV